MKSISNLIIMIPVTQRLLRAVLGHGRGFDPRDGRI
jgi:hypothetical protein